MCPILIYLRIYKYVYVCIYTYVHARLYLCVYMGMDSIKIRVIMQLTFIQRSRFFGIQKMKKFIITEVTIDHSEGSGIHLSNVFLFDWCHYRKLVTLGVNPIYLMTTRCAGRIRFHQASYRTMIFSMVSKQSCACYNSLSDVINAILPYQIHTLQLLFTDRLHNARRLINISSLWLRIVVCTVDYVSMLMLEITVND